MHPFNVLADPVRRRILELLAGGEHAAGDITIIIQQQFRLTQPAVSQQLKVLRDNGFATVRTEGARRIYSVAGAALREADLWLDRFRAFWSPSLAALATEVARGKRERRKRKLGTQRSDGVVSDRTGHGGAHDRRNRRRFQRA